ncbi:S-adenosyl-L-methionine-dependent methyltransferase [Ilyonectria sp. MPI-CAGE-AT-0026]|nr:S-adenosyl-L-methionine-dependent methyltransferase [Ilyonectria sp. MPI-CAGE-AT-0026]
MRHHYSSSDPDDVQFLTERQKTIWPRHGSTSTLSGSPPPVFEDIADEIIDLTNNLDTVGHGLLREGEFALETLRVSDSVIKPGMFLEVCKFLVGEYDANFILVRTIARCKNTGKVNIRGVPFARTRSVLDKLPKKSNEVCMILYFDGDSKRLQELVDKLEVCFIRQGRNKKKTEESLVRVHSDDVLDTQYRVSEDALSNQWRGSRVKGGSWIPYQRTGADFIDLEEAAATDSEGRRLRGQKYTVFDACSGAGGVSRGAQMTGFKIQYAVDKAEEVWDTYETNFPDTQLFPMSLDEFLSDPRSGHLRVDVLHFSPPCQYFSPAHTWAAAHDDENIFALFSCNQLLKKTRPRIITVEQTFGLTHDRHSTYFRAFLADFTQFGYSVRWKVVRLCTWGAAQDRKRLIIIAAAPGERLPTFPTATHSQDGEGGLLPFNSIQRALDGIQPGDDLQDLDNVKYYQPRRPSLDPNRLAGTITTGGSDVYFPDGTRELTLREIASLQGFPKNHTFLGTKTSIKRQIGNAFPPNTVRVLYRHIEEWLLKDDGVQPYQPSEDLILLDDESDTSMNISDDSEDEQASPEMDEGFMEVVGGSENRPVQVDDDGDCMVIDLT